MKVEELITLLSDLDPNHQVVIWQPPSGAGDWGVYLTPEITSDIIVEGAAGIWYPADEHPGKTEFDAVVLG